MTPPEDIDTMDEVRQHTQDIRNRLQHISWFKLKPRFVPIYETAQNVDMDEISDTFNWMTTGHVFEPSYEEAQNADMDEIPDTFNWMTTGHVLEPCYVTAQNADMVVIPDIRKCLLRSFWVSSIPFIEPSYVTAQNADMDEILDKLNELTIIDSVLSYVTTQNEDTDEIPAGCSFGVLRRRLHRRVMLKTNRKSDNGNQFAIKTGCEKTDVVMKLVRISSRLPNVRKTQQTLLKVFHNSFFMRQEMMKCMRMHPESRNFELLKLLVFQLCYTYTVIEKRFLRTNMNEQHFNSILSMMISGYKKHGAFHGHKQRKPMLPKTQFSQHYSACIKSLEQNILKKDEFETKKKNKETSEAIYFVNIPETVQHNDNIIFKLTTFIEDIDGVKKLKPNEDNYEQLNFSVACTQTFDENYVDDNANETLLGDVELNVDHEHECTVQIKQVTLSLNDNKQKITLQLNDVNWLREHLKKSRKPIRNIPTKAIEDDDATSVIREYTWLPYSTLPAPCLEQRDIVVANVTYTTLETVFSDLGQGHNPGPEITMKFELLRLCTLRNYPKENKPYLVRLAGTGFYYAANGDEVVCYCCGVRRSNWTANENPETVHRRISPKCSFLLRNEEVNYPVQSSEVGLAAKFAFLEEFPAPIIVAGDVVRQTDEASNYGEIGDRSPLPARETTSFSGTHTSAPKHPHYAVKAVRLNSFQGWPTTSYQDPTVLADAGFYFAGIGDCVRCFNCGIGLRHWTEEDDPNIEHARWSEHCSYLRQYKGEEFVQLVHLALRFTQDEEPSEPGSQPNEEVTRILMTDAAQSVVEMGYDARIIKRAIDALLRENGRSGMTAERIMEKVLALEETEGSDQKCGMQKGDEAASNASEACDEKASYGTNQGAAGQRFGAEDRPMQMGKSANDPRKIKAENTKLKEQTVCKVCLDRNVCIVFLPCGHLVTCAECAPALRKCPICRSLIKGTVKTYLS